MNLNTDDVGLFYELLWALQLYVDQHLGIVAKASSPEEYDAYSQEERLLVRDALFANPELILAFVAENPCHFSQEKLDIIQEWQYFVKGDFYIERYLKSHAIFIGEKVYGVLGLMDSLEDMFPKPYLPMYVHAILLPFKGNIIYDGLIQSYSIHFGSGIKSRLKDQYMKAKQQGTIIYSLGYHANANPVISVAKPNASVINWQKEVSALSEIAHKLKGGGGQPSINSSVFSLVKASIEMANSAVSSPEDLDALYQAIKKANKALIQVKNTFNRM